MIIKKNLEIIWMANISKKVMVLVQSSYRSLLLLETFSHDCFNCKCSYKTEDRKEAWNKETIFSYQLKEYLSKNKNSRSFFTDLVSSCAWSKWSQKVTKMWWNCKQIEINNYLNDCTSSSSLQLQVSSPKFVKLYESFETVSIKFILYSTVIMKMKKLNSKVCLQVLFHVIFLKACKGH